jgi:hypothetical protein
MQAYRPKTNPKEDDTRSCGTYMCYYTPGIVTDNGSLGPGADASLVRKWGTGDPGYKIKAEFNERKHEFGVLSMARSANPDSVCAPTPILNPRSPISPPHCTTLCMSCPSRVPRFGVHARLQAV